MAGQIDDHRTDEQRASTLGFVVATDSFMSGWGGAPARSIFAVPFETTDQMDAALDNMEHRSEMKRARVVQANHRWRLSEGDHVSIQSLDPEAAFYVRGYFAGQECRRRRERASY